MIDKQVQKENAYSPATYLIGHCLWRLDRSKIIPSILTGCRNLVYLSICRPTWGTCPWVPTRHWSTRPTHLQFYNSWKWVPQSYLGTYYLLYNRRAVTGYYYGYNIHFQMMNCLLYRPVVSFWSVLTSNAIMTAIKKSVVTDKLRQ
jgi:hypothetical protein